MSRLHPLFFMKILQAVSALTLMFAVSACSRSTEASASGSAHGHEHKAPHGGTAVVLGNESYHLEFVHNADSGTMTAYVLDGHMENFIRIEIESFEVLAKIGDKFRPLVFRAVANTATGETVGDTSQFQAQADWMTPESSFNATLKHLTIRGTTFKDVAFSFPGNHEMD